MNRQLQLLPLQHAAAGKLLFHTGRWGGHPGYRWRDQDGCDAGEVPQWESDALDSLSRDGLIAIEHRMCPLERRILVTANGWTALTCQQAA